MKRYRIFLVIILFSGAIMAQVTASQGTLTAKKEVVILTNSGWTIRADPEMKEMSLEHDKLGLVMKEIRLHLTTRQGLSELNDWTIVQKSDSQLIVQSLHPVSTWVFELNKNNVIISATTADMVLTSKTPSSAERVVCRLIDPQGVPVNWTGTSEITVSWQGNETLNPSNLPVRNPEVMNFALGQISAGNLHSLFDRRTDMAIVFPEQAGMQRDPRDPEMLITTIAVPGNTMIRLIPDYYTKTLGLPVYSRFDDTLFPSAPIIWGSWTSYYFNARESDIVNNTDWISSNLKSYGFQYVQIDDGYDRGKKEGHYWIDNWSKTLFPHGPEWLAKYIKSKCLKPGLWLVPNSYAGAFREHPEWYLYDKSGNAIMDYSTPALDYTNPGVQEWLGKLFTTLRGWGFEYFKFDGELYLPKYAPAVDRSRLYDKLTDPLVSYRNRLTLIRNIIGPGTFVEGCVAGSPLNGIGFFNSCFNGADMYNSWKGCYAVFSSVNANAFLNHMVTYVMPGEGIDVSPLMSAEEARQKMDPRTIEVALSREDPFTGFGTSLAEARTLVSFISLTGVAYPLTSIMSRLPEERVRLLKMTMPTMPILPVDLFSRGTDITWDTFKHTTPDVYIHNYPEILDLKVNAMSGVYDVVALINWRSDRTSKVISFSEKLGLDAAVPYVVFDFWNQKQLGIFTDHIDIDIDPHDTRVLLVHKLENRPQLIGLSRHISGACSILDMHWNSSENNLSGSSETVQGDTYSLFIYVPDKFKVSHSQAKTADNHDVILNKEQVGNSLKLSFQGQPQIVKWQVEFAGPDGTIVK